MHFGRFHAFHLNFQVSFREFLTSTRLTICPSFFHLKIHTHGDRFPPSVSFSQECQLFLEKKNAVQQEEVENIRQNKFHEKQKFDDKFQLREVVKLIFRTVKTGNFRKVDFKIKESTWNRPK